MICARVRELAPEDVAAHRASCPDCALAEAMGRLRESSGAPSARVDAAVAAAFRERRPPKSYATWWIGAAAAVLVLGLAWKGLAPPLVRRESAAVPARDVYQQFHAIGPGPVFEAGELAPVIRMRLPGREAARLGLPVEWERRISSVEVDVVVGRDGMAKAVRLVRLGSQ